MRCAAIAIVSAFATVGGCENDQQPTELETVERYEDTMHAPDVRITDVVEDPARYEGQSVRIRGVVSAMLNPRAIVVEEAGVIGTRSMLILTRNPANPMGWLMQPGQQAIAVGRILSADVVSIEQELGRELELEVRRALHAAPVVIARSVGRVHGDNVDWTEPAWR
jgi:hypothetical protein